MHIVQSTTKPSIEYLRVVKMRWELSLVPTLHLRDVLYPWAYYDPLENMK
jgi:hypothetical protein